MSQEPDPRRARSCSEESDGQTLSRGDQTAADADQRNADIDQTASDSDQSGSDRDQRASDRDQAAADRDQARSDKGHDASGVDERYAESRRERSASTRQRDLATHARSRGSALRDEAALRRDGIAAERDAAARARDELAAALDDEIERMERQRGEENGKSDGGAAVLARVTEDRNRAAASRARAAQQRVAAANDRAQAARDRELAAEDRRAAAAELAMEGLDHLTGALRRRVGLAAIRRELDRTDRSGEQLVVAFVDVVGLKAVNDSEGHEAGDRLLRAVAVSIQHNLRSYDLITRYGGDEFVCSLTGQDLAAARERFEGISRELQARPEHGAISVGLAERADGDSLDDLIKRADEAMLGGRRRTA